MDLAAPPSRKTRVGGRSRRNGGFWPGEQLLSPILHRGCNRPSYGFAPGNFYPKIDFIEIGAVGSSADPATIARVAAAADKATQDTAKPKPKKPPMVKRNVWGDYVDQLISYSVAKPRKASTRYYVNANHMYSVAAVTSASGEVIERWSYNSYGVETVKSSIGDTIAKSAVNADRAFTGYLVDGETGLYYARSRMFSSDLGRFISRDGMGYVDGYDSYAAYMVPNQVDPSGNYSTRPYPSCLLDPCGCNPLVWLPERWFPLPRHDEVFENPQIPGFPPPQPVPPVPPEQQGFANGPGWAVAAPADIWTFDSIAQSYVLTRDQLQAAMERDPGLRNRISAYLHEHNMRELFRTQPRPDFAGEAYNHGVTGIALASVVGAIAQLPQILRNAANRAVTLDASAIRFSQSNVRSSLPEIAQSMRANGWQGAPIDVVRMANGTLTAVDNTRLAAANLSRTPVQAIIRNFDEVFPAARAGGNLQGATWGEAVANRIAGQRPLWQRLYPNGSPFTGIHPSTPPFSPP